MKVRELISELQSLDSEEEICVLSRLPNRPSGGIMEPVHSIYSVIDQDTNQTSYVIDTGIGEKERIKNWKKD